MRRNDPTLAHIEAALDDYYLTTEPHRAHSAEAAVRIAEHLVTAGYTIRPARRRLRRFLPLGGRHTHQVTYAATVATMAAAILCSFVQLWAPAAVLIVSSAYLADQAHRQRHARAVAADAERAARPVPAAGRG